MQGIDRLARETVNGLVKSMSERYERLRQAQLAARPSALALRIRAVRT